MSAVRTMKDGREICQKTPAGQREYRYRTTEMWVRDAYLCWLCFRPIVLDELTFDHRDGRGGGKRDDRIEHNGVAHYFGNMARGLIRL